MEQDMDAWTAATATVIRAEMTAQRPRLSQGALAEKVGIGREALNSYLNGRREMPLAVLFGIAEVLGATPQWILDEADRRLDRGR